ncbi:MAG TPA: putative Ig domain-containing protein, partial [Terriglobia bacterium]|nr:putative Ig domain-containing protein [Terriglobia bacterium]
MVKVASGAEPPLLDSINDRVAVIGKTFQIVIAASDMDQDPLQFSGTNLPAGSTLLPGVLYGSAIFTWTPSAADTGSHVLTFTVTDSTGGTDSRTISVLVRASNSAPILLPVGNQTVAENALLDLHLSAIDTDNDPLTWHVSNPPPGAVFDPNAGILKWQTNYFSAGTYNNIVLSVTDGSGTSTETISITVTPSNQAPQLALLPPFGTQEQQLLQFNLVGADADGDALIYGALSPLPQGAEFDSSNGRFTWIPGYEQAGEYAITFFARDATGATDTLDVHISVANVNRLPVLSFTNHQVALGDTLTFTAAGSDLDAGEVLTFGARSLPEGAVFNSATGQFTWT